MRLWAGRDFAPSAPMAASTLFLLSPAHCAGRRAAVLLRPEANFALAVRLRSPEGAELGEVFSFLSGLYFRGKAAYARRFARPLAPLPGALVITSGRGLLPPDTRIGPEDIEGFAGIDIDRRNPAYTEPILADAHRLANSLPPASRVVLLGSIATAKYIEPLLSALGETLCFPRSFIGVGDMARGAMMLRAAAEGVELDYVSAFGAVRSLAKARDQAAR
jgi:hypothetical protein